MDMAEPAVARVDALAQAEQAMLDRGEQPALEQHDVRRENQIIGGLGGKIVENLFSEPEPGGEQGVEMRIVQDHRSVIVEQADRRPVRIGLELGVADDAMIVGADDAGGQHPVAGFCAWQQDIVEQAYFLREAD